jgi:hypothetical protein
MRWRGEGPKFDAFEIICDGMVGKHVYINSN